MEKNPYELEMSHQTLLYRLDVKVFFPEAAKYLYFHATVIFQALTLKSKHLGQCHIILSDPKIR